MQFCTEQLTRQSHWGGMQPGTVTWTQVLRHALVLNNLLWTCAVDRKWHHNSSNNDCNDHTAGFACFDPLIEHYTFILYITGNHFTPSMHQLIRRCRYVLGIQLAETWNMPESEHSSQQTSCLPFVFDQINLHLQMQQKCDFDNNESRRDVHRDGWFKGELHPS